MPFSNLFPKEMKQGLQSLKVGKGYAWQGDFVLWQEASRGFQLNGTLRGKDFEVLGYQLNRLEGEIEASPEHVYLSNLRIEDEAGAIGIQKVELKRQASWSIFIPQILVRELQPSLLRKVDGSSPPVKPFTIRNFLLKEIRGSVGDKSTLEAFGHLTFTNQFKKGSSLLDLPLEMIKKIGLDPGMLTPVQGEFDLELRGDKFYLLTLSNAFSEGNRSEFYLAPTSNLSYIDLDGKMHIDLKLYQDVLLKLAEPFTLTIRGTLDKPRYGLQY